MKSKATVDRFEADKAVLIIEGQEALVVVPRSLLPKEAKEGDALLVTFEIDEEATKEAKDETTELIRKLSQDS